MRMFLGTIIVLAADTNEWRAGGLCLMLWGIYGNMMDKLDEIKRRQSWPK